MEKKVSSVTPSPGLALLRAAWSAGFDISVCSLCFYFSYCQYLNHHDIKFDPTCDSFVLAAPVVPLA